MSEKRREKGLEDEEERREEGFSFSFLRHTRPRQPRATTALSIQRVVSGVVVGIIPHRWTEDSGLLQQRQSPQSGPFVLIARMKKDESYERAGTASPNYSRQRYPPCRGELLCCLSFQATEKKEPLQSYYSFKLIKAEFLVLCNHRCTPSSLRRTE
ncbi:hypothetical protein O3P69_005664 [Scylla paramamosain]|uniref:Uncharacterized protein n=1 Tax=Scylla paramamosain TaxID=85552 RepID=A0AAW0U6M1_SCYPA